MKYLNRAPRCACGFLEPLCPIHHCPDVPAAPKLSLVASSTAGRRNQRKSVPTIEVGDIVAGWKVTQRSRFIKRKETVLDMECVKCASERSVSLRHVRKAKTDGINIRCYKCMPAFGENRKIGQPKP
jgi:hypothetical protein